VRTDGACRRVSRHVALATAGPLVITDLIIVSYDDDHDDDWEYRTTTYCRNPFLRKLFFVLLLVN